MNFPYHDGPGTPLWQSFQLPRQQLQSKEETGTLVKNALRLKKLNALSVVLNGHRCP